jgi:hypothetical protein
MSRSRNKLLLIWIVVAGLAAAIYVGERKRSASINAPIVKDEKRLLPALIEDVSGIEIIANGAMHRFERDKQGVWFYHGAHDQAQADHGHKTDPALAAIIDKAFTTLGRARWERALPLAGSEEFGVARPDYFVAIYLPNAVEPIARYAIGTTTPDKYGRYVMRVGADHVVTVAEYQISNLQTLIDTVSAKK